MGEVHCNIRNATAPVNRPRVIQHLEVGKLSWGKTEMSHINCLTMTRDCKIYFLVFDRLDLRCAIWPKLCPIISFVHHYENYTFLKRFKCT